MLFTWRTITIITRWRLYFLTFTTSKARIPKAGPSRATVGPRKPLSRGPITISFHMHRDQDAEGVEREETWGEVPPHYPTRGLGNVVAPQWGPGQSPGPLPRPKMDFMHIWGQKEAIWNTLFSISEQWRGPHTSRGPGKLSPFMPSRRACPKELSRELL